MSTSPAHTATDNGAPNQHAAYRQRAAAWQQRRSRHRQRRSDALRSTDPSKTKTTREAYARSLRGGFARINTVIREAVRDEDIFGLENAALGLSNHPTDAYLRRPRSRDFEFARDDHKVDRFVDWLEGAQGDEVLSIIGENENRYIRSGYERGLKNAQGHLREAGVSMDVDDVQSLFNQPVHEQTLQNLYTRNFRELRGITEAVDQQVSRELSQAFLEGVNPRETAKRITDRVDAIGKNRATVLARTETLHAHNESALTRYEQILGPDAEVQIEAEILTAQDNRVCDECEPRHGNRMSLSEARSDGPPWHPSCRCTFRPVVNN